MVKCASERGECKRGLVYRSLPQETGVCYKEVTDSRMFFYHGWKLEGELEHQALPTLKRPYHEDSTF